MLIQCFFRQQQFFQIEINSFLHLFHFVNYDNYNNQQSIHYVYRFKKTLFYLDSPDNKLVEVRVSAKDSPKVEQALYQRIVSNNIGFFEEAIMHGQTNIEHVLPGSVVLQLRPVTDEAVQTLLNAKENNALLDMIFGMLKQANIYEILDSSESLELKVQVCYANPDQGDPKPCKLTLYSNKTQNFKYMRICLSSFIQLKPCFLVALYVAIPKRLF